LLTPQDDEGKAIRRNQKQSATERDQNHYHAGAASVHRAAQLQHLLH